MPNSPGDSPPARVPLADSPSARAASKSRNSYTTVYKVRVAEMVVIDGKKQRAVAESEGISFKNVSHWIKSLASLKEDLIQNPKGFRLARDSKFEYLFEEVTEEFRPRSGKSQ